MDGEREAEIKRLQEQLTEANQANEASRATQANQNQSSQSIQASDANVPSDANQALQEELAKLRQEVLPHPAFSKSFYSHCIDLHLSIDTIEYWNETLERSSLMSLYFI